jgi:hypothetical protein
MHDQPASFIVYNASHYTIHTYHPDLYFSKAASTHQHKLNHGSIQQLPPSPPLAEKKANLYSYVDAHPKAM